MIEKRVKELADRWKTVPAYCNRLEIPVPKRMEMEVCAIGNHVAKRIATRCLRGKEKSFTIDVSRQSRSPAAIKAFVDLSFGNIWDVATFGECREWFNMDYNRETGKIRVKYE